MTSTTDGYTHKSQQPDDKESFAYSEPENKTSSCLTPTDSEPQGGSPGLVLAAYEVDLPAVGSGAVH